MSARRLRIAMLSVHSCPLGNLGARDTGGMNVYIREVAIELGRQGHVVDVYTRVHDPRDRQTYELGRNARLIHLRAGEDEEIHKLAVYSHLPDFACHLESFRKNHSLGYDLVFSHYWLSAWVGRYLQLWWGVPHIAMFHTLGALKNSIGIGEDEPELRIETERDLAKDCHRIIAATEKEKAALVRYYGALPERIGVVPCGVNLETFRPINKRAARRELGLADGQIILFVGRIEPLKGLDQLLRAMAYLTRANGLKLVVIGGDEHSQLEVERLENLAHRLHIGGLVDFLGLVKQERMPYFYSAADVCVVPSYYESFGLVALESLACGTPVVANDVGDLRNIIHQGETGYVVVDNTPWRLANRISSLLSTSGLDQDSALSIRASVARFSWTTVAQAVAEECRSVVADYLTPCSS